MARILNIDNATGAVTIGMDNGGVRIVPIGEIDYDYPMVGDFVNVVETPGDVVVTKADEPTTASTHEEWAKMHGSQGYYQAQGQPMYGYGAGPTPGAYYYNQPVGKPVDKIAYVLFAILLGSFGVHKFYAGKIGLGVLYICFCWTGVPTLVGLIEGIIAATKPQDAQGRIYIT